MEPSGAGQSPAPEPGGLDWDDTLAELAAEASTLQERLAGGAFVPPGGDAALIEERRRIWAASLSKQNPDLLDARLALSGWDFATVAPLLGPVRLAGPPPGWIGLFRDAVAQAEAAGGGDFYEPFLRVARARLAEVVKDLPVNALAECERSLGARLAAVAGEALEAEGAQPGECFARTDFFRKYPVAARRLSEVTGYWVEALGEFFHRLDRDAAEIREEFFAGREPGRVAALSGFASDSHCRGRAVIVVSFENGDRLVYKPRSVGLEAGYFDILAWLEKHGAPVVLRAARAMDRGDYGWMEWIGACECTSEDGIPNFYRRMGGLLAVSHALAGADLHFENLIACGDHPIAIDTEVWMAPTFEKSEIFRDDPALRAAWENFSHSVLAAAILPAWVPIGRDRSWNLGAVESEGGLDGLMQAATSAHMPRWRGRAVPSRGHRGSLLGGFRDMYGFLFVSREKLLAADGPLAALRGRPVRFVNRPTELYGRALRRSFRPEALRSGIVRSFALEAFLKPALHAEGRNRPSQLAIGTSEILALERGDVPFFQGEVGSRRIRLPETGDVIEEFFTRDGFDVAEDRLRGLSESELDWQAEMISVSFALIAGRPCQDEPEWEPAAVNFADEALAIAERIERAAISADGSPAWIAPREIGVGRFTLSPIDGNLYDGTLGTMVFLLALERVSSNSRAGEMARAIFRQAIRTSAHPLQQALQPGRFPGLLGLGGVIHALCLGHRLCGERGMLDLAHRIAGDITDDFIRQSAPAGLVRGHAGLLLALEALHRGSAESRWLAVANKVREQLRGADQGSGIEGLVLDRLQNRDSRKSMIVEAEKAAALPLSPADQLFSGNASRANLLIAASRQPGHSRYRDAAENLLRRAVARARAQGGYVCYGNHAPTVSGPGFFQGLAGIGYVMLRLVEPALPGVLFD